jgi:hypothetical protein
MFYPIFRKPKVFLEECGPDPWRSVAITRPLVAVYRESTLACGGRLIVGIGNPESNIQDNVGDIFQHLDGALGTTFWVKGIGNGTNTDCKAK